MATQITVPHTFSVDFKFYCDKLGMDKFEISDLRDAVRADFEKVGAWITKTVAVYRFCDSTWGKLPTVDQCENYLIGKRYYPADSSIFTRWGILLLAELCYDVVLESNAT